ncbi:MAG: PH domain-containing protein [Gammaproteobacteria bacterium]|nr:PH domain-containing protein [Gammaproteobacteria bacterium]NNC98137.1 PH domain-containing protein [Gammaproteobacteria bacterium]NNM12963.1 PH domain-containing protein [Gammaproteobacteria bacterium]
MARLQEYESLEPMRLHQLSPIFLFLDTIKEFFLLIILILFTSRSSSWELYGIGFAAIFVLVRMISFRFFKYWILPHELVVKSGVFFRQERHIPYERVQNINQTQGPLHRLFGVGKVQLESASGTKPEAEFNVISLAAINAIRNAVEKRSSDKGSDEQAGVAAVEAPVKPAPLLGLAAIDLVKHGVITNQGMIPVAIVMGFLFQQEEFLYDLVLPKLQVIFPSLSTLDPAALVATPLLLISALIGLVLFALMFFWVLSIAVSFFRFFGFTLSKQQDKLKAEMGLLTRHTASAPLRRIQKITLQEGVLHRLFKAASITCKTAGNAPDNNSQSKSFHYLAPLIDRSRVQEFLDNVQAEIPWQQLFDNNTHWTAIPFRAWTRMVKIPLLLSLIAGVVLWFVAPWWALLVIPLCAWSIYATRKLARSMAYWQSGDLIAYKSGWLSKRLSVVQLKKAQVVRLSENPFDRRRNMASLYVDTAGFSMADHNIDIPYLDKPNALHLQDEINQALCRLEFEW